MHGFPAKEDICEDGNEVGDVVDCSACGEKVRKVGKLSLDVLGVCRKWGSAYTEELIIELNAVLEPR